MLLTTYSSSFASARGTNPRFISGARNASSRGNQAVISSSEQMMCGVCSCTSSCSYKQKKKKVSPGLTLICSIFPNSFSVGSYSFRHLFPASLSGVRNERQPAPFPRLAPPPDVEWDAGVARRSAFRWKIGRFAPSKTDS